MSSNQMPVRRSTWVVLSLILVGLVVGILLLLAGSPQPDPVRSPAVWISPDGSSWEHISLEAGGDQRLVAVASDQGNLVAVGAGKSGGTIWTSDDGQSWRRTWTVDGHEFADVVAGGPGWVVAGGSWNAAIHTSANGVTWNQAFSSPESTMRVAERFGSSLVVAGATWPDGGEAQATVWTSPDATEWSVLALPGGGGDVIVALAQFGGELLAVADTGAIWVSADATAWESVATSGFAPLSVNAVAASNWLLAVGWAGPDTAGMWASTDGRVWAEVDPPDDWDPHGAVVDGSAMIALGRIGDCTTSVLSVSADGAVVSQSGDGPPWLSNECRDGIPHSDDECEDSSARAYDSVDLPGGGLVIVGHW